jgi:hypothetical protein
VGLLGTGEHLNDLGREAPELDPNQECRNRHLVAAETECLELTELVDLLFLRDPQGDNRKISRCV